MFIQRNVRSFTIVEVLLVVVVIGIIASIAIPRYNKAIEKASERRMFASMQAIKGALPIYNARYGEYPQVSYADTAAINSGLNLDLYDPDVNYTYTPNVIGLYTILASNTKHGWSMHMHTDFSTDIHCTSAGCPSCVETHAAPGCSY